MVGCPRGGKAQQSQRANRVALVAIGRVGLPCRSNEHEIIQVPVVLLFCGVALTMLGLFVGLPLRYPDLSSLVVSAPARRPPSKAPFLSLSHLKRSSALSTSTRQQTLHARRRAVWWAHITENTRSLLRKTRR